MTPSDGLHSSPEEVWLPEVHVGDSGRSLDGVAGAASLVPKWIAFNFKHRTYPNDDPGEGHNSNLAGKKGRLPMRFAVTVVITRRHSRPVPERSLRFCARLYSNEVWVRSVCRL